MMTTLDEAYAAEGIAKPKGRNRRPEHALQTLLRGLCREYIDCRHLFAAHDRSESRSRMQHFWEKQRGAVAGWPDIEIVLPGGRTFRCELKRRGAKVKEGSEQERILKELNGLGHVACWADCAVQFVTVAQGCSIPFREGVIRRAVAIDAMLDAGAPSRKSAKSGRPRREPTNAAGLRVMARARAKGILA